MRGVSQTTQFISNDSVPSWEKYVGWKVIYRVKDDISGER